MKVFVRSVLLLGFIAITTQDITGRKGCDCSVCKGVDNKINPIVGKKIKDEIGGKSSCNICEHRKEMLRLEREKQRQLQKCPFEILGAPALKGKTSEEIFDEFRELVVPSQNGFFDMMRGIVKTMHVSSEAELKWAKEKEARELAKKKKEEEARKLEELKARKEELVNLNNPIKQTPCGPVISISEPAFSEIIPMIKRIPKKATGDSQQEVLDLQPIEFERNDETERDYLDINSKGNLLHSDVIEQLVGYNIITSTPVENEVTESTENPYTLGDGNNLMESSTESPFVKYVSNEELKAMYGRKSSPDDFDYSLFPIDLQGIDNGNTQNVDYSVTPDLM